MLFLRKNLKTTFKSLNKVKYVLNLLTNDSSGYSCVTLGTCILKLPLKVLVIGTDSLTAREKGSQLGNFPYVEKRNRLSRKQIVALGLERLDSGIFKDPTY